MTSRVVFGRNHLRLAYAEVDIAVADAMIGAGDMSASLSLSSPDQTITVVEGDAVKRIFVVVVVGGG
jgi:hypothetical protein